MTKTTNVSVNKTLMPGFTKEAQQMLEEIKAEKRQQQTGYKFLDLNCTAGRKEFEKMMKNMKTKRNN